MDEAISKTFKVEVTICNNPSNNYTFEYLNSSNSWGSIEKK